MFLQVVGEQWVALAWRDTRPSGHRAITSICAGADYRAGRRMDFNGMAAKRHKTLKSSSVYVPLAPSCGYSPLRICEVLRDFLDDIIEDQLELDSGFKEKIERAKKEIADGVYSRVRQPQPEK